MRTAGKAMLGVMLLGMASVLPTTSFAESNSTPNGLNVGGGRLHPYFELDGRYDSAGGFFAGTNENLRLSDEILAQFRPGFAFAYDTKSTLINVDGMLNYFFYTGLLNPSSRGVSRFQGDGNVVAHFNRDGVLSIKLSDSLARSNQTSNVLLAIGALMFRNEARVETPIRPGGGALEFTPSFAWAVEMYEPLSRLTVSDCRAGDPQCSPNALADMNFSNFNFGLDSRWRFLPKTALVLKATHDERTYPSSRNRLLQVQTGLQGLVTPKLGVLATIGYGYDFALTSAQGVIAQAEITYHLSETAELTGGYGRSLAPIAIYGGQGSNRVYAQAKALLTGRLSVHALASADFIEFYKAVNSQLPARSDQMIMVDAGPDFELSSWMKVSAGYTFSYRSSTNSLQGFNFPRHEGYLRFNLHY